MSSAIHDLSISASIISGFLAAIALVITAVEWIVRGSLDPTIGTIGALLAGAFVTSVTGQFIAKQVQTGQPVLPTNGVLKHNGTNGGTTDGSTNQSTSP